MTDIESILTLFGWCSKLLVNIIIIIITLFESQIILAEHECCTDWGDCKSNKSNQIKCRFLKRGENRSSRRKTSRSRVENQQTQPTYDAGSGNRTRDTLVEGERSHHYTNPAPLIKGDILRPVSEACFALIRTGIVVSAYKIGNWAAIDGATEFNL